MNVRWKERAKGHPEGFSDQATYLPKVTTQAQGGIIKKPFPGKQDSKRNLSDQVSY